MRRSPALRHLRPVRRTARRDAGTCLGRPTVRSPCGACTTKLGSRTLFPVDRCSARLACLLALPPPWLVAQRPELPPTVVPLISTRGVSRGLLATGGLTTLLIALFRQPRHGYSLGHELAVIAAALICSA